MIERFKNNKGSASIFDMVIIIGLICVIGGMLIVLMASTVTMNKINVYSHGKEAAHIEVDKNLTFDGYEWNDGDLILHYKEK